jgi:hypothetical protein
VFSESALCLVNQSHLRLDPFSYGIRTHCTAPGCEKTFADGSGRRKHYLKVHAASNLGLDLTDVLSQVADFSVQPFTTSPRSDSPSDFDYDMSSSEPRASTTGAKIQSHSEPAVMTDSVSSDELKSNHHNRPRWTDDPNGVSMPPPQWAPEGSEAFLPFYEEDRPLLFVGRVLPHLPSRLPPNSPARLRPNPRMLFD